jgi:hypothetical protein
MKEAKPNMDSIIGQPDPSSAVGVAKDACGIHVPNSEMTDDQIVKVVRWVGEHAPDTRWEDGKPVIGRRGIEAMLTMTVVEFPEFYEKHGLSQWN